MCTWTLTVKMRHYAGFWANGHDGTKYWKAVLEHLKNRGLKDAFVLCTDELKGLPKAIEVVFRTRRCRSILCISSGRV